MKNFVLTRENGDELTFKAKNFKVYFGNKDNDNKNFVYFYDEQNNCTGVYSGDFEVINTEEEE